MRWLSIVGLVCVLSGCAMAADVTVSYLGHSCFTIQEEGGPIIMIDSYSTYVPYPALPKPADIVLITHQHVDHDPASFGEFDRVEGNPAFVRLLGPTGRCREQVPPNVWIITDEFKTSAVEGSHENARGGGSGYVCIYIFDVGGIRFAHLGDLGALLTAKQTMALSDVDVPFTPVGRAYTLDAAEAMTVLAQLPSLRIAIPMHYKVAGITPWPDMAPLTEFTTLAELMGTVVDKGTSTVVLSPETLPESTEVWTLEFAK